MDNAINTDYIYKALAIFNNVVFLFYFLLTLKYVSNQLFFSKKRYHFMVYWFDIIFILFYFICLSVFYSLYIFYNGNKEINDLLKFIEIYLPIVLSGNFVMNIVLSFILLKSIYKIKSLNIEGIYPIELINFVDKIDIIGIYSIFPHFIKTIIIVFIEVVVISYIFYEFQSNHIYINLYQGICFFIQLIFIMILSSNYKKLKSELFFSHNISNEKIYDITKQKIIILSEHLMNKSIYDLILNIPTIIRFAIDQNLIINDKLFITSQILLENVASIIYIILFGAMLLKIDKKNKIKIPKIIKFLYILKLFNNSFGSKNNKIKLFKPIIIDQSKNSILENSNSDEEELYLNESEQKLYEILIKNNSDFQLFKDENKSKIEEERKSKNLSEFVNRSMIEQFLDKGEKDYLPCNLFILFKLLYLYFKTNLNIYKKVEKEIEEEGIPFKNLSSKDKLNINNIRETVSKLTRISINNTEKLIGYKKWELKQLMSSIDDKIIKEDFIKYIIRDDSFSKSTSLSNKRNSSNASNEKDDNNSENSNSRNKSRNTRSTNSIIINTSYDDVEFIIESLMGDTLFDLYPFFQISINDILNSLDMSNNKEILNFLFENKMKNNSFNSYYSKDAFLTFEIYENNSISYSKLKNFILNYKKYLIEQISNFNYSFLPIILGIFNIRYLNFNKIIVLLKNPLSFTTFINYNYWIKFTFSDGNEVKNISTKAGIIDTNEIEIKDNIELQEDEYNEIVLILQNDMNFLKSQNIELDFELNLFIIKDIKQKINISIENSMNISEIETNKNLNLTNNINTNLGIPDSNDSFRPTNSQNEGFDTILRDTSIFNENIIYAVKNAKKYFGSEVLSLLEKLYINSSDKQYIFTIFFSEIFKNKKRDINKENENFNNISNIYTSNLNSVSIDENEIKENNNKYCIYLKSRILRKIKRANSSFFSTSKNKFYLTIEENEI